MSNAEVDESEFTTVEKWCEERQREAVAALGQVSLPTGEQSVQEMVDALRKVRANLDFVDGVYAKVVAVRTSVRNRVEAVTAEKEDAWSRAARGTDRKSAASWRDLAPRERYAEADLATLDIRRSARRHQELRTTVEGTIETLKTVRWNLEGVRNDLISILKAVQVEIGYDR